ncbi:hypothetical protein B0H10DRAFT_1947004 [Mycena sp. CBHHK59/15]|nr:hypothetical protein B0H10DRAFT_1947004 [Mycena sp. CBHHK59/15]
MLVPGNPVLDTESDHQHIELLLDGKVGLGRKSLVSAISGHERISDVVSQGAWEWANDVAAELAAAEAYDLGGELPDAGVVWGIWDTRVSSLDESVSNFEGREVMRAESVLVLVGCWTRDATKERIVCQSSRGTEQILAEVDLGVNIVDSFVKALNGLAGSWEF